MDLRDVIPGYGQLLEGESLNRDSCLLNIPESIGPFFVRSMTLRDYLALKRHPLLKDQQPTVGDLVVFIRFLWVGNKRTVFNLPARWLFGRRCFKWVKSNYEEIDRQCLDYLESTFADAVSPKVSCWSPPYYSEGVGYIALFSRVHRWTPERTLDMPMKLVLQVKREIEHMAGEQPGNRSDRLIVQHTLSMRRN